MNESSPLRDFAVEWARYLQLRGHRVRRARGPLDTLLSRNGRAGRYRWLLLHAKGSTRRLTAIEHEHIQRQLRRAEKTREQVYVVVVFDRAGRRVVMLPAARAARIGHVRADKGGIAWEW